MNEVKLSQKQQEIVDIDSGAILVKASAGSGKTRVLTERIKRLLTITKRKTLAITFTNKAGEEMKSRLGNLPASDSRLFISTFHGFCEQVLSNHGNLIGYSNIPHIFGEESDRLELIGQAIENTPSYFESYSKVETKQQKEFRFNALGFISEVKRNLLTPDELFRDGHDESLVLLFSSYQDILNSQNAIDYDDLILLTYNLFIENTKIAELYRRTYEYICIDEAQDLNYAQYQLIRALTGTEHKNVMMVGDPNQSIFAFTGSSADYMNTMFVEDYKPKVIELKENYRSANNVLLAADKIIPDSCDNMNSVIPGIFEIHGLKNENDEAHWIVNKIAELIEKGQHCDIEGKIVYEKIAVIARNKYVFKDLTKIFEENIVPYYYKITPGAIQFESNMFKIFDLAFKVKLNQKDTLHWYKLLALFKNKKVKNLAELVSSLDTMQEKEILEMVINLNEDGSNLTSALNKLKNTIVHNQIDENGNEQKLILNDIEELAMHWHQYGIKNDKKSLLQFKNSMALGKTHPLTQKNGITLSTVHTMKGQEYDIVFLMGMDDETFPDYRAIRNGGAELVQEKNNVYVAFTRAKRFLYVTWPAERLMPWGDCKNRHISRFLEKF